MASEELKLRETCQCGGEFSISFRDMYIREFAKERYQEFIKAHEVCRNNGEWIKEKEMKIE